MVMGLCPYAATAPQQPSPGHCRPPPSAGHPAAKPDAAGDVRGCPGTSGDPAGIGAVDTIATMPRPRPGQSCASKMLPRGQSHACKMLPRRTRPGLPGQAGPPRPAAEEMLDAIGHHLRNTSHWHKETNSWHGGCVQWAHPLSAARCAHGQGAQASRWPGLRHLPGSPLAFEQAGRGSAAAPAVGAASCTDRPWPLCAVFEAKVWPLWRHGGGAGPQCTHVGHVAAKPRQVPLYAHCPGQWPPRTTAHMPAASLSAWD